MNNDMNNTLTMQILNTLPPFKEGRDRQFKFEPDGTIIYDREEGDWDPPRQIEGFKTDENDQWRMQPQWDNCPSRLYTAVRFPNCGCIGIVARCNEPKADFFIKRVSIEICEQCPLYHEVRHGL